MLRLLQNTALSGVFVGGFSFRVESPIFVLIMLVIYGLVPKYRLVASEMLQYQVGVSFLSEVLQDVYLIYKGIYFLFDPIWPANS